MRKRKISVTKFLNVACGKSFHKDWINIDFHSESKFVNQINIFDGIPLKRNSIDAIYCSHFLEHLNSSQTNFVLKEFLRVLKTCGILRIVVPDLENICQEYIKMLKLVRKDPDQHLFYEWITKELLDQLARTKAGGEMGVFFDEVKKTKNYKIAQYIYKRTGDDVLKRTRDPPKKITLAKLKNKLIYSYLKLIKFLIPQKLRDSVFIDTTIGENHRWLYDSYSLSRVLKKNGFRSIEIQTFNTSNIKSFNDYLLDIDENNQPRKGESSLYIEAMK
jgi:predicted SAM-dependent methyltransferase